MSIAVVRERAEAREADEAEKDAPLRADIRLLGRMLGDTVREQEGAEVFAIVERIRQASIRFHRDNEIGARRELEATLDSLDNDQTLTHRARLQLFLASGQHRRGPAPHPPQPRPCADEVGAAAGRAGLRLQARRGSRHRRRALRAFFDHALVSPVLTAHPTEVRRKSTLTRELEIAALLDARQRLGGRRGRDSRSIEEQLRARHPHPVAHQHAAPDAAEGDRRGRQRPFLLRLHVLSRAAAHLRRDRGRAGAPGAGGRGQAHRLVPARRLVDRRRSRRQSLRHRRRAAARRRGCRAPARSSIISRNCTSWAASCR